MKLTLIGMSNIGKTYWSKKMERIGFRRFGCDDMIAEKLNVHDVSGWLGQPYDKRYKKNSAAYLHFEEEAIGEILSKLEKFKNGTRVIVDTTGSLIYLNKLILTKLKKYTKFVYLDLPRPVKKIMCQNYFRNPKPVIWGDSYQIDNGYSKKETLSLCYPKLLEYRLKKYRFYSDLTMNYYLLRSKNFSTENFLNIVKSQYI